MMMFKKNTSGKIVLAIVLCIGFFISISWDRLLYEPAPRISFTLNEEREYVQLLPNTVNLSSITSEARKVYARWDQQYDLRIIVIVYNRAQSMLRLLNSLNSAKYFNDRVKLEVWIDRSFNGSVDPITLDKAEKFEFYHGEYEVIIHPEHVGIIGQWLSTWRVWEKSTEIAVILEDDLTVSPYFYKYLKLVHEKYDNNPKVNGYALQGVSIKHSLNSPGILVGPKDDVVFLYPVIGTWGFSPSARNWVQFIDWFNTMYRERAFEPYVYGNVVTLWYKEFQRDQKTGGIWSIWHIYFAWKQEEFTLYSNFEGRSHFPLSMFLIHKKNIFLEQRSFVN